MNKSERPCFSESTASEISEYVGCSWAYPGQMFVFHNLASSVFSQVSDMHIPDMIRWVPVAGGDTARLGLDGHMVTRLVLSDTCTRERDDQGEVHVSLTVFAAMADLD